MLPYSHTLTVKAFQRILLGNYLKHIAFWLTGGDWEITGICPRGYYCPIGTRFPEEFGCPNGTFNDQTGITSEDECQYCWQGKTIIIFFEFLDILNVGFNHF